VQAEIDVSKVSITVYITFFPFLNLNSPHLLVVFSGHKVLLSPSDGSSDSNVMSDETAQGLSSSGRPPRRDERPPRRDGPRRDGPSQGGARRSGGTSARQGKLYSPICLKIEFS
jgi:hypothetical protein